MITIEIYKNEEFKTVVNVRKEEKVENILPLVANALHLIQDAPSHVTV